MQPPKDQVKSRERVSAFGEVFTAEREVNAMLDLVKPETERVDSRFLEPACGTGNFLAEILRRKLAAAKRQSVPPRTGRPHPAEFERLSVTAVSSLYGVDLMADNVEACRERLYAIWDGQYEAICKGEASAECRGAVRFILRRNIVCGNALTLMRVDENQQDTSEPIVFSEWSFPFNDTRMQRRDFSFAELLSSAKVKENIRKTGQGDLFADENGEVKPTFLKQYISDYRRVQDYGD